jgi:poly(3-hydroxybutyrate) depolymerase
MPTAARRLQGKPPFTIPNCGRRYIPAMKRPAPTLLALLSMCTIDAHAAQTVTLPNWVCKHPDAIFVSEFDTVEVPVVRDPTEGSGGATGTTTHTLHIAGLGTGTQTYYLYVPASYTSSQAYPFLLALHGTAPYASRKAYASDVLSDWSAVAAAAEIIVAAPVADARVDVGGQAGASWSVPPDSPSDYDLFAAALSEVEGRYNIDRTRIAGWGFSSGGSVMHALGLTGDSAAFNNTTMAGYGVAAGALAGLLCADLSSASCDSIVEAAPRKIPIALAVGTADTTYGYVISDDNRFQADGWTENGNVFLNTSSDGHVYSTIEMQAAWGHLCPDSVTP